MVYSKLSAMAKKRGIQRTADILGVTYSYVHKMLAGKCPISKQVEAKFHELEPRKYPKTLTVRYSDHEEARRQRHMKIPPAERPDALDYWLERKDLI